MAYKKKNLTPAERSEIARKAQAARKNRRGGRPKGWKKDPSERKKPKVMRSLGVYEEDYRIFRRLADYLGKTMADMMHAIAVKRVETNPGIFKEQVEVKTDL